MNQTKEAQFAKQLLHHAKMQAAPEVAAALAGTKLAIFLASAALLLSAIAFVTVLILAR